MKIKTAYLAILAFLSCQFAFATNLKTAFIQMPDSIMPLLTRNDRMDFLDYMDNGMTPKVRNRLGGESVMSFMDGSHLTVQVTNESVFDMFLLEKKDGSTLICVINTVNPGYADSRIGFYDDAWNSVASEQFLERPSLGDFITPKALKLDSVNVLFDQSLLRLSSAEYRDGSLFFRYTSLGYIGEDAIKFQDYFRQDPIEYRWNGKRFRKVGK